MICPPSISTSAKTRCTATPETDLKRRAARTVMEQLLLSLTSWLAPILPFTAEETWQEWKKAGHEGEESIHLRQYPVFPTEWRDEALGQKWEKIRIYRSAVTSEIEKLRADKTIGSSLEARARLFLSKEDETALADVNWAEVCITSQVEVESQGTGQRINIERASGTKCERCWRVLPEVGQSKTHADLCQRCESVVA